MTKRCIPILVLLCGTAHAGWKDDLQFARRLGGAGYFRMATQVYESLGRSSDSQAVQAGRYGLAMLDKQRAERAMTRFLAALRAEDRQPDVPRERILELFRKAAPDIQTFVDQNPDQVEARFDLAELYVEHARFLTGANYPEELKSEQEKLAGENREEADGLFQKAIEEFDKVYEIYSKKEDDESYQRATFAAYNRAVALMHLALAFPEGSVKRSYNLESAIDALDNFNAEHFSELIGQWAMLYLGRCFYHQGHAKGNRDGNLEMAVNYFEKLFTDLDEDAANPELGKVMAEGFYWYCRTCNDLASGARKLKPKPTFYENTLRAAALLQSKLVHGAKLPRALQCKLLIARAQAAQGNLPGAIGLAGEVLKTARFEGYRAVRDEATETLTGWLSSAGGSLTLGADLLYQIGESLLAQRDIPRAVAAYQQAAGAALAEEDRGKWGDCGLKIATAFYRDHRYHAAAMSGLDVVGAFVETGEAEDTPFGAAAGDACNLARLSWKKISEATRRSADEGEYRRVLDLFRARFPRHKENADKDYAEAKEVYDKKEYAQAAVMFAKIGPTSKNYWAARRRVPVCWYNLAQGQAAEGKADAARESLEKGLAAALELKKLGEEGGNLKAARAAAQVGRVYTANGYFELQKWAEALQEIDGYLRDYPGEYPLKGKELEIKIRAHLHRREVEAAEAALRKLETEQRGYRGRRTLLFAVYKGLGEAYRALGEEDPKRTATARRAATLYARYIEESRLTQPAYIAALGGVYEDAGEHEKAGDAYRDAAEGAGEGDPRSASWSLRAAANKYRAALASNDARYRQKVLDETSKLFAQVVVKDPKQRTRVIKALGNPGAYPGRKIFGQVVRQVGTLILAAKVFQDASPAGVDGRWVAVRLLDHLHKFTIPVADPAKPQLDKYIDAWWEGAGLKLRILRRIAREGRGTEPGRKAAGSGLKYLTVLKLKYPSTLDAKVPDHQKIETDLKRLK
ncbi:MAG: hypothetical protein ACE5JG_02600 [Planctomycetota bacterium]